MSTRNATRRVQVPHRKPADMAGIEDARRQDPEEELLGITRHILRHHARRIRCRPAARKADLDILKQNVLDPMPGNPGDHDPLPVTLVSRNRHPNMERRDKEVSTCRQLRVFNR